MEVNKRQGDDPNFPNGSGFLISSVRCMVMHGWDAKLHQQQGPVPGGSSSRSSVGTCFPEEPLWKRRFRRSDYWTAKTWVCTVRNTVGLQNWVTLLMTEGISIATLNVHMQMEKRHGGLHLWSQGWDDLQEVRCTSPELNHWAPLLSDGSCLKNRAEELASWLSVTAMAAKPDKGTSSHKSSSDLHTQAGAHMYPCIHRHINKQQT